MQFRAGRYYMHRNARDICILVNAVVRIGHSSVTLSIYSVNLGYTGCPWIVDTSPNYTIEEKEYDNYIEIPEEKLYEARTEAGLPNL